MGEKDGKPVPDPALSVLDIRDSFNRMDHEDRATVALIGGGHTFGKTHGACPEGPGLSPLKAYNQTPPQFPWMGNCGSGRGEHTFTSGFEGPWTTKPTQWDNEFFKLLLEKEWEKHMGPGGHWQWRVKDAEDSFKGIMRLTSDMALIYDDKYLEIVKEYATNMKAFDDDFDDAWFKLTTRGNRWINSPRCDSGTFPESSRPARVMLSD